MRILVASRPRDSLAVMFGGRFLVASAFAALVGCSAESAANDLAAVDAAQLVSDDAAAPLDATLLVDLASPVDAVKPECQWKGAAGSCMSAPSCSAIPDRSPEPVTSCPSGYCCIDTPDVGDNPPIPAGYKLMSQSMVTPEMTKWAVAILNDPVTYPMYSTTTRTFGSQPVLARVEWHPPDFQNHVVHRGVTLYVPA